MEIKILIRLILDFLFAASLFLIFPRGLLVLGVVVAFTGILGLTISSSYFETSLSFATLCANFGEGVAVTDAIFALLPYGFTVLLFSVNAIVIALFFMAGKPPWVYRKRFCCGLSVACIYLFIVLGLGQVPQISFYKLQGWKGTGDVAVVFGIIPTWVGEWLTKDNQHLIEIALSQPRTDRLTPKEAVIELPDNVVLVQIESLDYTIIDRKINGHVVTPFLNDLKKKSFYYKVDSFHRNGSADADFSMMSIREPSPSILNYKIEGLPYHDTLPENFGKNGYRTRFFHNATYMFYSRLPVFQKMGFHDIYFVEDLIEHFHVVPEKGRTFLGALFVDDKQLLDLVAQNVVDSKGKNFFFTITLVTHIPYVLVQEKEIFPEPSGMFQNYVNSIHYVDRILGDFYNALPEGTLVVFYGDHCTSIREGDYIARRKGEKDFVPCMISITGTSLAERQKTESAFACGGELSLVDIANYIRSLLDDRRCNDKAGR